MIIPLAVLGLAASSQVEPFAGVYVEVGGLDGCRLEVTSAVFVLSCPDEKPMPGAVHAGGEALVFGVTPTARAGNDDEYGKAYSAFMRRHFVEHGTYPLVFPPSRVEVPLPLVPVAGPNAQFLVSPYERDGFCDALVAGREPTEPTPRMQLLRKTGSGAIAGTPWRVFCEPGREPHIVIPGLER